MFSKQHLAQVRAVKAHYEPMLMRKPNVVGVGIGIQQRQAQPTGQLALVVNVTHKVPWEDLPDQDRIPQELDGVPVDVQEVGHLMAHRPPETPSS
jgi:hypothetical protein